MWNDTMIDQLRLGKNGVFYFGNQSVKDIGEFKPIIDASKSLPVSEIKQTVYWCGSMVMRNNKNGRIQ
jgi:hypothetical protein